MGNNATKAEREYFLTKSVDAYLRTAAEEFTYKWNYPIRNNASLQEFTRLKTLGAGAFGRVVLVQHKANKEYYAMKILDKDLIVKTDQVEHTLNEKRVLQAVNFPFVVKMDYSFKDNANLFLVLDFISGGDMFALLQKFGRFKEGHSKLYAGQVVLAFEYLHAMDIMHRDLKPENLLVDSSGFLKLTDMGFAKRTKGRTYTLCGTPDYLAPEIILNKGYSSAVDWWMLGILLYEINAGYPPFSGTEHLSIYENIVRGKYRFPKDFSEDLKDLCRHLIHADLTRRYGNLRNGVNDIKNHPWFQEINWISLYKKKIRAPYVPRTKDPGDTSNFHDMKEVELKQSGKEKYANEFKDF